MSSPENKLEKKSAPLPEKASRETGEEQDRLTRQKELKHRAHYMVREFNIYSDSSRYLDDFDLTKKELKGRIVLDIGAGAGNFAKQAKREGLNVVPVDLIYSIRKGREAYQYKGGALKDKIVSAIFRKKPELPPAVAATFENLPFRNQVFDYVTFHNSLSLFWDSKEDLVDSIEESFPVLKKGGEILIYPIFIREDHELFQTEEHPSNINPKDVFFVNGARVKINAKEIIDSLENEIINFSARVPCRGGALMKLLIKGENIAHMACFAKLSINTSQQ